MRNKNHRLRRGLALATVVSALAAPAASAATAEQLFPSGSGDRPSGQPTQVRVVEVGTESGFDWGDAGIGATGVLALLTIAAGAAVATGHRPQRGHTVA